LKKLLLDVRPIKKKDPVDWVAAVTVDIGLEGLDLEIPAGH